MSLEFEIPLVSLIFILILNIVYFSKKRADLEENKPYKVILISSLIVAAIDTVIHIICSANTFESIVNNYYTLLNYLNKILSSLFSVIFSNLFFYTLLITYDKVRKNPKKISTILIIANIVFSVIMLFTNIKLVDAKVATNVTGATTMLGYAMVAIMLTGSLLVALTNIKKLDKRYLPIFIVFLLLVILYFFSLLIPGMIIYDLILALMCYIMYFTIENPDMKMLDEVHKAKVISDNANEEKTLFLYNMTNEIRGITKDIDKETDNILDETDNKKIDVEEINNSARNIKGSTAKFTTMTNEILDISSIDSASVRIYNEKYNIKRLLKELVGIYKPKAQNKNLDFRVSIASDIPEYLYGDSINLKKVLTIILDNSIKYTNNGYIEFNINTIIKGDIVRLIISVEDSGIGMKAEDINKIFTKKQEREDNHNLNNNLYNAKRLITLMNGTIVPSSSYGSGTTIKIILDQKYDTIDTDINKYDNIYDKKKVLLIDDSPSSEKLFNKILSGTNIELTSVKLGNEGLEKIRNKEKYDLILLDEELEPQNGHIIMRKLLEIRNFNTKVILLTKDNKYDYDDSYLQEGFTDYIIKSSDKEEMLNKIAYIADYEGRSVNSQVLVLIRDNIKAFEDANGAIDGNITPASNVKPTRK